MADPHRHRGPHPGDSTLFAPAAWPGLQRAAGELHWLLDRGYALRSSLALVGDRHHLTQRQRLALARAACTAAQRAARAARECPLAAVRGQLLWIDGYNLLITIESALAGGILLRARDGALRDMASLHGSYRHVSETDPALALIGRGLHDCGVSGCHWVLDQPVSNSGRLRGILAEVAAAAGWPWEIELHPQPDRRLAASPGPVASADSVILDRAPRWFNAAWHLVTGGVPEARILDLSAPAAGEAEPAVDPRAGAKPLAPGVL